MFRRFMIFVTFLARIGIFLDFQGFPLVPGGLAELGTSWGGAWGSSAEVFGEYWERVGIFSGAPAGVEVVWGFHGIRGGHFWEILGADFCDGVNVRVAPLAAQRDTMPKVRRRRRRFLRK